MGLCKGKELNIKNNEEKNIRIYLYEYFTLEHINFEKELINKMVDKIIKYKYITVHSGDFNKRNILNCDFKKKIYKQYTLERWECCEDIAVLYKNNFNDFPDLYFNNIVIPSSELILDTSNNIININTNKYNNYFDKNNIFKCMKPKLYSLKNILNNYKEKIPVSPK